MIPTSMSSLDRFFGDMEVYECRCGLAAPRASLKDPERRREVLQRFQENPMRQLPSRSEPDPAPAAAREKKQSLPKPRPRLHCPRCGEQLDVSRLAQEDRFFDDYLKCPCGAVLWNQFSDGERPPPECPAVEKPAREAQPTLPVPAATPIPIPELWMTHYWVRIESQGPASFGLPRQCGETVVKCGRRFDEGDYSRYPRGFHAALPENVRGTKIDLRAEVGCLYEELLKLQYDSKFLDHLLSPLELLSRVVEAEHTGRVAFELLREQQFPNSVLYLSEYFDRLFRTPIIPRQGQRISLFQLGTTPGYIDPTALELQAGQLEVLKKVVGPYRFARPSS